MSLYYSGTVRIQKMPGIINAKKSGPGGTENYTLTEKNGVTALMVKTDVPQELEEMFNIRLPRVMERIKMLAEEI